MRSPNQQLLFDWWKGDKDTVIAQGKIRSGKSYAMGIAFIFWAMHNFDMQNFIMAGQSIGSLKRNITNKLIQILKQSQTIKFTVKVNESKNYFDVFYKNKWNRFYLFHGSNADSYISIHGLTAAGAMFDEALLLNQEFVNQAIARCSVDGAKFWMTLNPGSPMHWLKTEWIDKLEEKNALLIKFGFEDNHTLTQKTIDMYMRTYRGVFKKRYIENEWAASEGVIYDNWTVDEFNFKRMELEKGYDRKFKYVRIAGLDFGSNNPNAFIAGLLSKKDETIYWYNEIYERKQRLKDLNKKISTKVEKNRKIIGDGNVPELIDQLYDFGQNIERAKKPPGSVKTGIMKLLGYKMVVHPTCTNLIDELNSYSWAIDKNTNLPLDEPKKENDHLCDAMRYAMQCAETNFEFEG